jgi:hypothetical protein
MRAFVLPVLICVSMALSAHSFGASFEFTNLFRQAGLDAPIFDAEGRPAEGTNYLVELYGGLNADALSPAVDTLESGQRKMAIFRLPGYFSSGAVWIATVPITLSGPVWLQVRAWDARLGATYEEVATLGLGGYGESELFQAFGGYDGAPGNAPELLRGLKSFQLRPIAGAVLFHSIRRDGDAVVLEWRPGFKKYQLQETSILGEPWRDLGEPTTATVITNSMGGPMNFFRVIGLLE